MISQATLPPPVRAGARVGIAALSGPVAPELLGQGVAALSRLGFVPVLARNLTSRSGPSGMFAGTDAERLDAFHELADDSSIEAIFFARGGHGVLRLLDRIDWARLAEHPRAYVGYSDLTPFLNAVVARLGIVAFHGPLVAADLARGLGFDEEASLLGALAGDYPAIQPFDCWLGQVLTGGDASGPLVGGCLSLVTALLGTPYALDFEGAVALFEDVGEPPYRIDRMIAHLRLAGGFEQASGIVIGHLVGPWEDPKSDEWAAVLTDAFANYRGPIAFGHNTGHRSPNWTLPLGLPVQLEGDRRRLVVGTR